MKLSDILESVVSFPTKHRHHQVQKDRGLVYDEITGRWNPKPPKSDQPEFVIVGKDDQKGYGWAVGRKAAIKKRAELQLKHGVELEIEPWD